VRLTSATLDPVARDLVVEAQVENQGERSNLLQADAHIDQGGVAIASGSLRTPAEVAGRASAAATVEIGRLPTSFDPARATLVLGAENLRQVRVPLTGNGPAVTGQPREERPPGPLRAGSLTVTFDHLWLRGDSPLDHAQAERDRSYVILSGSVRFLGLLSNLQSDNLALTPPAGRPEAPSYVNLLPEMSRTEPIYAVFEMPAPLGGSYLLRVQGNYALDTVGLATVPASGETRLTLGAYPPV
jgi:hypothetical protein